MEKAEKKLDKVEDLPPKELAEFVMAWCDGRVFSSWHVHEQKAIDLLPIVFMPITLGIMDKYSRKGISDIGLVWEFLDAPGRSSRVINGMPIFSSLRVLSSDDWERAMEAINKETARRKASSESIEESLK